MEKLRWSSGSGEIELELTAEQVRSVTISGRNDEVVAALMKQPEIAAQLNALNPALVVRTLKDYGAWSSEELCSAEDNRARLIWSACWDLHESGDA